MKSHKLNMRRTLYLRKYRIQHFDRNTEFIFTKSCRNILMSMSIDIRINTQCNRSYILLFLGKFFYNRQLLCRFHIKAKYLLFKGIFYFPVGLSNPGKYNFFCRKPCLQSSFYFPSAHTIGSYSRSRDKFQYFWISIGFYSIMNMIIPFSCQANQFC